MMKISASFPPLDGHLWLSQSICDACWTDLHNIIIRLGLLITFAHYRLDYAYM